ncbi:MAG: HD-GYP domain-containing protein [Lachnospiraceae bacterium]|nr:HD-GYP domain-containing protein [Lachnospiraceae bacterium]
MWKINPKEILKQGCVKDAIYDSDGRLLLEESHVITDEIRNILERGDRSMYIWRKPKFEGDETPIVRPKAPAPDDEKLVVLTEEVKKSAIDAIDYLYNNHDIEESIEKIDDLSQTLVDIIYGDENVGISLDELKCSDEYTFKHSLDVAAISIMIGKMLGLSEQELKDLSTAGLLHDLGKTRIPSDILNAQRKLTDIEFKMMKTHPVYGYQNIMEIKTIPDHVKLGVLQHHEKWSGNGYPQKLPGDKICLFARILTVADVYDALVTARPYKAAFSPSHAVEMMMAMTADFDIHILRVFLRSIVLYPVGSQVLLSNGEIATVVKNNKENILRPEVVNAEGKKYDLFNDLSCLTITVMEKVE